MAKVSNPVLSMEARGSIGQVSTYRQMGGASVVNAKRVTPTIDNSLPAIRRKFLYSLKSKMIATITSDTGRGGWFDAIDNILRSSQDVFEIWLGANWRERLQSDEFHSQLFEILNRIEVWTPIDPTHWRWEIAFLDPEFRSVHNAQGLTGFDGSSQSRIVRYDAWQVTITIREWMQMIITFDRFIPGTGEQPNFDLWTAGLYTTNPLNVDGAKLARVRARLRDR